MASGAGAALSPPPSSHYRSFHGRSTALSLPSSIHYRPLQFRPVAVLMASGAGAALSLPPSSHYKSFHGRSTARSLPSSIHYRPLQFRPVAGRSTARSLPSSIHYRPLQFRPVAVHGSKQDPIPEKPHPDEELSDPGVRAALSVLRFYRREISPLLLPSCRYVPSCSVYSMEAYKKYGFSKGTILTAWRLCRCNPLGGSGFDPPRWFGEESSSDQ